MSDKIYYQDETKKAINNFGYELLPVEFVTAYGEVKKASIMALQENDNRFSTPEYSSIIQAVDEIINGLLNDQFVIPLRQGGAGTSLNMNLNEVIALRSGEILKEKYNIDKIFDSLEDINRYQSTNDTFPTAVTITVYRKLVIVEEKIVKLQEALISKEIQYDNVIITGRTEMQDALPIKLGQVFAGWAGMIERDRWRLNKLKDRIRNIALGGTAIGTCFFAPQKYIFLAERFLKEITKLPLCRSQNLTDEIANADKYSELANGLKIAAENLFKISGDLLLYSSSFLKEIIHPNLQYGSTIMPAKTNPVILEFVRGLSIDIQHECNKVSSFSQNGQLQLNAYLPFILKSLINSFDLLNKAVESLIEQFFNLMNINKNEIEKNLINSYALINTLAPVFGYREIKKLYKIIDSSTILDIKDIKDIIKKEFNIDEESINKLFETTRLTSFLKN
ncbi:MAG: fumarate lyase [Spirochaetes bacterium]|nr:fumarate lyase [Spirochaetota bacterium]